VAGGSSLPPILSWGITPSGAWLLVRRQGVQAVAYAIDPRLRLLCLATFTERAQEVRDGLKRVIEIREVLFRMGRGWVHTTTEIAISHDRDEQMCWLNLDSDDAHT
jgi:hypothetical protein